ncbi:MAG TPA: DUF3482 domain-containing protein [Burkholderiales bacterium]|nr:DUF3482 domain-containing protein [Burkholderiales bacterium]
MTTAIDITLVSHTNAGKTTLLRTLVRRDVGEVADRAHVTSRADAHVLVETPEGDVLRLWDTPGFGDSVRLLKRLRMSSNPIGWFLTRVWDRYTDRPFFNSQIAIRNVRERTDVVLYLVNAAEDPASAAYVDVELRILDWMKRPVLVLLNQMGAPRPRDQEAAEEELWRAHIARHPAAVGPVAMDAFARCWVQEDRLLAAVADLLAGGKAAAFDRIRTTWRTGNLTIFVRSMEILAKQLALAATDREARSAPGLAHRLTRWLKQWRTRPAQLEPEVEAAMNSLGERLAVSVKEATDELIALHGLSGRSEKLILERLAGDAAVVKEPVDVGATGVLGGFVTGAATGLAADLVAGGMSLGAGALIGGIVGAFGGAGAAHAYNLAREADELHVGWSGKFLTQRVQAALLRYLAIAHFGRGRGDWIEGEYPPHWQTRVSGLVSRNAQALEDAWGAAHRGASPNEVAQWLQPIMTRLAAETLVRLYPESARIFEAADARSAACDL